MLYKTHAFLIYFKGAFDAYLYKNKDLAKVTSFGYQINSFKSSFMLSMPQVIESYKRQREVFLKEGRDRLTDKLTESFPSLTFAANRALGENAESLQYQAQDDQ